MLKVTQSIFLDIIFSTKHDIFVLFNLKQEYIRCIRQRFNMRIVQTFWTAGRDPLKYPFGWSHPEHNLMSWALSCLSLREH